MNENQLQGFMEKFFATAVANQAILKCNSRGLPLTEDNVIFFVGDFFDPTDPVFEGIVDKINDAIGYIVQSPDDNASDDAGGLDNVIQFRPRPRSLQS
jgi:hypothetical protein